MSTAKALPIEEEPQALRDLEERAFLHDIAGPLAAAMFVLEAMGDELRDESGAPDRDRLRSEITQARQALDKLAGQLRARRQVLISKGKPGG